MNTSTKKRLINFSIIIAFLAVGAGGMFILLKSKKPLEKKKAETLAPVVRTVEVKTGEHSVIITGEGTVRPLMEITLVPQVDGKVVYASPSLVNGGIFKKGDILLRIEQADYNLAVTLATAKVRSAESILQQVQQESEAAREEWRLHHGLDTETNTPPPPLVAKEPQLAAAKAGLAANIAELKKARLNLERTELKAPFNGRVGQENVDIGQYVRPGQSLATLYSTDAAEIVLPFEEKDLAWFHVPGFTSGNGSGSSVNIFATIAGQNLSWKGNVVRAEGKLDERTRMINVVVRVDKPYSTKPPLAVGLFVTVVIEGSRLPNATIIPRAGLRQGNIVWIVNIKDRLNFKEVEIARFEDGNVVVKSGLDGDERVVVSPLKVVTDGMKVRAVMMQGNGS